MFGIPKAVILSRDFFQRLGEVILALNHLSVKCKGCFGLARHEMDVLCVPRVGLMSALVGCFKEYHGYYYPDVGGSNAA